MRGALDLIDYDAIFVSHSNFLQQTSYTSIARRRVDISLISRRFLVEPLQHQLLRLVGYIPSRFCGESWPSKTAARERSWSCLFKLRWAMLGSAYHEYDFQLGYGWLILRVDGFSNRSL